MTGGCQGKSSGRSTLVWIMKLAGMPNPHLKYKQYDPYKAPVRVGSGLDIVWVAPLEMGLGLHFISMVPCSSDMGSGLALCLRHLQTKGSSGI